MDNKPWTEKEGLPMVMAYFGAKIGQFRKEWAALTDKDKADIKNGLENRSETY
jgi:hypothetical protein